MRSSRTLLSYHDEDIPLDYRDHDNGDASLEDISPEAPSLAAAKLAASAMMGGQGSDVANFASEDDNLEAYMMHPDMEAKIIPIDTMALINRSSNKWRNLKTIF